MSKLVLAVLIAAVACIVSSLGAHAISDTKLAPAEVVTKHLESIGSSEARSRVHGTMIKGNFTIIVREGGTGEAQGQVLLASEGDKNLTRLNFDSEQATWFKFDGSKTSVSQFRPGRRTSLENFFASFELLTKEGLVGGTLSESWPLLNVQAKNPKLEYSGTKEVGGKKLIAIKYSPHKSSDMKITLFFEPETFHHVRTEYSQTLYAADQQRIPGGRGLPAPSETRATPTRITAVEEFDNFKPEQGLNLPHTYKFELSIQSDVRPALINLTFDLSEFKFDSAFDQVSVGI